jgi:alpha-1,3-mannosyltransferase
VRKPVGSSRNDRSSTRRIGRVEVQVLEQLAALQLMLSRIESGEPHLVGFCNAHTVNLAARDDAFVTALQSFVMLNDGIGVDLASRILYGEPFPTNLVGTDFVPALLNTAQFDLRVYLLGSSATAVGEARASLTKSHPRHTIVGAHHGFFSSAEHEAIVDDIRAASPDLILVGMGQPRQELWSYHNLADVPAVTICVGALFEFIAGSVPRAPRWMRSARLEWLYRLALEPRRLGRRYLIGNVEFMARLLRSHASQPRSSPRKQRRC